MKKVLYIMTIDSLVLTHFIQRLIFPSKELKNQISFYLRRRAHKQRLGGSSPAAYWSSFALPIRSRERTAASIGRYGCQERVSNEGIQRDLPGGSNGLSGGQGIGIRRSLQHACNRKFTREEYTDGFSPYGGFFLRQVVACMDRVAGPNQA